MTLPRHWLVYCRKSGPPRVRHSSREAAVAEARRLAGENPARAYLVLEVVDAFCRIGDGPVEAVPLMPMDPDRPAGHGWRRHDGTVPTAPVVDVLLRNGGLLRGQLTASLDWGIGPGPTDIIHVREIAGPGDLAED